MYGRFAVDPRVVTKIGRSPKMVQEQAEFIRTWGTPREYSKIAKLKGKDREVYMAIREGVSEPSQVEIATGLSPSEISASVSRLERKGLVESTEPSFERGLPRRPYATGVSRFIERLR